MMKIWLGKHAVNIKCVTAPKTRLFYDLLQTAHNIDILIAHTLGIGKSNDLFSTQNVDGIK